VEDDFSQPIRIPDIFIKRLIVTNRNKEDILEELILLSRKHRYEMNELIYYFVMKCFKMNLYFETKKENIEYFLFEAVYWSSVTETKKKIRPKTMADIPLEKNNDVYTKLQKNATLAIFHKFKEDKIELEIQLNNIFRTFFELSCIKRDRRKNK